MQIGSTPAAAAPPAPTGSGVYLDRIKQQLATVNDGKATLRERGEAYQSLLAVDDGFYSRSTEEERKLRATLFDSSLFKQVDAAATKFSNEGMSLGRARTAGANMFDRLNKLSEDQQYLIYLGTTDLDQAKRTPDLESWKSVLQEWKVQSAAIEAADAASKAKPAISVELSDEAKALLDATGQDDPTLTPAQQALKRLSSEAPANSMASVALQTLQDAAKAREDSKAKAKDEANEVASAYAPGAAADRSV